MAERNAGQFPKVKRCELIKGRTRIGAPGDPTTLDPGETACDEAARSMKRADTASGRHVFDIGPGFAEVKLMPKRNLLNGSVGP